LKFPVTVAVTITVNLKDHKMPVRRLDSRTVQQRMTHKTTMQMLTVQQRMAHRTTMQSLARFNKLMALLRLNRFLRRLRQDLTKAYCYRTNSLSAIAASAATLYGKWSKCSITSPKRNNQGNGNRDQLEFEDWRMG
jgi:hypothetical protein